MVSHWLTSTKQILELLVKFKDFFYLLQFFTTAIVYEFFLQTQVHVQLAAHKNKRLLTAIFTDFSKSSFVKYKCMHGIFKFLIKF